MSMKWKKWLTTIVFLLPSLAFTQQRCVTGIRIEGTVTDQTGAVIPGAQVQTLNGESVVTDASGHFLFSCAPANSNTLTLEADGFTSETTTFGGQAGGVVHLNVHLAVAQVETVVRVDDDGGSTDGDRTSGTTTLNTSDVQQLADDPDDFLRQLQTFSASSGGSPTPAASTITHS